jgi:hypothetical protein
MKITSEEKEERRIVLKAAYEGVLGNCLLVQTSIFGLLEELHLEEGAQ